MTRQSDDEGLARAASLRKLRELREAQAQRSVARERQEANRCAWAVQQARTEEARCRMLQQAQRQQVQAMGRGAGGQGQPAGVSMAQLQHAMAWSTELRQRTDVARLGVRHAQMREQEQQERLDEERKAWADAQRGVDKAMGLQRSLKADSARRQELRLEDAWDDAASQARARSGARRS